MTFPKTIHFLSDNTSADFVEQVGLIGKNKVTEPTALYKYNNGIKKGKTCEFTLKRIEYLQSVNLLKTK